MILVNHEICACFENTFNKFSFVLNFICGIQVGGFLIALDYSWKGHNVSHIPKGRSSHLRCSVKKGVLKNFANFTGKHLCLSLFFNKVADLRLRPATLLKKKLQHRCFPVKFTKLLRTSYLKNICERLLLKGS